MKRPIPSISYLRSRLDYTPSSGSLTWKDLPINLRMRGQPAGNATRLGYRRIWIDGWLYYAQRIVWRMMTGDDPGEDEIDHKNLDGLDQRWLNLRRASKVSNAQNRSLRCDNTSGIKGVGRAKKSWYASVTADNMVYPLGFFANKHDAEQAVRAKREVLHQGYVNHG